jgi:hypothetical protein
MAPIPATRKGRSLMTALLETASGTSAIAGTNRPQREFPVDDDLARPRTANPLPP